MTITERIAKELVRLFPNFPVYTENQSGGFTEPSFFIEQITMSSKSEMFDVQFRKYTYQVVYFPDLKNPKTDMEKIGDKLLSNLLKLDDFSSLKNIELKQLDNHLFYKFEIWGRFRLDNLETMQKHLNMKGNIK